MMKRNARSSTGLLASAAILASFTAGGNALAQVVATDSYCIPAVGNLSGGFKITDIGSTLVANGGAEVLPDGRLQLTRGNLPNGQSATMFYQEPLTFRYTNEPLKTPRQFHVFFSFSMGAAPIEAEAGAGLAFLVQNNLSSSIGANGDGMGYGGLTKSFAFEFDTHQDVPSMGTVKYEDPIQDHLGFMLDGNQAGHPAFFKPLDSNQNQLELNSQGPILKRFYVWIDYAGGTGPDAKKYKLYLAETKTKPAASIVWEEHKDFIGADPQNPNFPESGFDPDYWLSTQNAGAPGQGWVGFSSATYGPIIKNDHFIHEFEFSNKGIPCACQGADACKTAAGTAACSAGPMTQGLGECVECTEADDTPCTGAKPVCDKFKEVCVQCNTNLDCPMMDKPQCELIGHTCVPCATDMDCAGQPNTPVCINGGTPTAACVECVDNADCTGTPMTPVCSPATQTCVQCEANTDCSGTTPVCDLPNRVCVQCTSNTDCGGTTPVCDLPAQVCVQCTADTDCGGTTPVCDVPNQVCVECKADTDCSGTTPVCDVPNQTCVECKADSDCGGATPVCDVPNQTCVECNANSDCHSEAAICNVPKHTCEPCTTNADCTAYVETPVCQLVGVNAGQCGAGPKLPEEIEGGGFACAFSGLSTDKGSIAGLIAALGAGAMVIRRRKRTAAKTKHTGTKVVPFGKGIDQ